MNLFERFMVYGLAKIQRDSKYPIIIIMIIILETFCQRSISTYKAKITFYKSNY